MNNIHLHKSDERKSWEREREKKTTRMQTELNDNKMFRNYSEFANTQHLGKTWALSFVNIIRICRGCVDESLLRAATEKEHLQASATNKHSAFSWITQSSRWDPCTILGTEVMLAVAIPVAVVGIDSLFGMRIQHFQHIKSPVSIVPSKENRSTTNCLCSEMFSSVFGCLIVHNCTEWNMW